MFADRSAGAVRYQEIPQEWTIMRAYWQAQRLLRESDERRMNLSCSDAVCMACDIVNGEQTYRGQLPLLRRGGR